jgi:hypothetical protein
VLLTKSAPDSHIDTDFVKLTYQAYLHIQMGINALDGAHYNEAAGCFAAAINTISFSSMLTIHSKYDVFIMVC